LVGKYCDINPDALAAVSIQSRHFGGIDSVIVDPAATLPVAYFQTY